jgi:signal peptidase II
MRPKPLAVLLSTAAVVVVLDQLSKVAVRTALPLHGRFWLLPPVLSLTHVQNMGAAFSLLQGQRWFFIGTALVVLGAVAWVWWRYRPTDTWVVLALGLAVGGAVGNLIDRATAGTVTDFIDFQVFPVFNIADSSIVVGVAILVVWLLFVQPGQDRGSADPAGPGTASGAPRPQDPGDGSSR